MGTTPCGFFFAISTKGNNFMTSCLLSRTMKPFQNGVYLKGKNLLLGEQILSFKSDPIEKRDKDENGRVASPESVSIHLKL